MYAVSLMVLVMLGALIRGSSAIRCYSCLSNDGYECDDHTFDPKTRVIGCATREFNACWILRGHAYCKMTYIFLVVNFLVLEVHWHFVACRDHHSKNWFTG